jgi:hypothetical protein
MFHFHFNEDDTGIDTVDTSIGQLWLTDNSRFIPGPSYTLLHRFVHNVFVVLVAPVLLPASVLH